MIEHLQLGLAASFHRRRRKVSDVRVRDLFTRVRTAATRPSRNLFKMVRVAHDDAVYSAIAFAYDRTPSFLESDSAVTERIYGFLMFIEHMEHVAVMKSGLDLPTQFKADYLEPIPVDRIDKAIAIRAAVFQHMRLRNMSVSKHIMRAKSFNANDLAVVTPTAGANRFAPLAYRLTINDAVYSATPGTGRISERATRVGLHEAVGWASRLIRMIVDAEDDPSGFMGNFTRPESLAALPEGVEAKLFAIDVPNLAELLLGEDPELLFVRNQNGAWSPLTDAEVKEVLTALEVNFHLRGADAVKQIEHPDGAERIGTVRFNKQRIALKKLDLPSLDGLHVELRNVNVDGDIERVELVRWLDRADAFTVLFSAVEYAYLSGTLFRDPTLAGGGAAFLKHLKPKDALVGIDDEKGDFVDGQDEFGDESVFRKIVDDLAHDCDVLVCDDLNDEWADFIGLTTDAEQAVVSFYHAKGGKNSMGASSFHAAVAQALKNLDNMNLAEDRMGAKFDVWERTYNNANAQTSIDRIHRGGDRAEVETAFEAVRTAPDLSKRVFIVTTSLSYAGVAKVFADAELGIPPAPHFVQLYHLLNIYFAGCREMGANGYVMCRP